MKPRTPRGRYRADLYARGPRSGTDAGKPDKIGHVFVADRRGKVEAENPREGVDIFVLPQRPLSLVPVPVLTVTNRSHDPSAAVFPVKIGAVTSIALRI